MADENIWDLVAFLRKMPALPPDQYRGSVETNGGHPRGAPSAAEPPETGERLVHEDGTRHQH